MAFTNLPHDETLNDLYDDVDIPYNGYKLLNRIINSGYELIKYKDNIAKHPSLIQYGAVLKRTNSIY